MLINARIRIDRETLVDIDVASGGLERLPDLIYYHLVMYSCRLQMISTRQLPFETTGGVRATTIKTLSNKDDVCTPIFESQTDSNAG